MKPIGMQMIRRIVPTLVIAWRMDWYPEKFCVNELPINRSLLDRQSCPIPLVISVLPEDRLAMHALA